MDARELRALAAVIDHNERQADGLVADSDFAKLLRGLNVELRTLAVTDVPDALRSAAA
jgi:hypothetical protein